MPTLTQIRRRMLELEAGALGRVVPVTALATGSLTSNVLRFGAKNQTFSEKWIVRPEAADVADRVRLSLNFTPSTGVITHAGANYADTTATNEEAEILEHQPYMFDLAICKGMQRVRRRYRGLLPTFPGEWYSLHDLDWIRQPSDVLGVAYRGSPVMSRNSYFEDWSAYDASAVLTPDAWVLAGSGGTMARSTTGVRRGKYSVALTRSGTNLTLTNTVGILWNGVSDDSLRGKAVTGYALAQSSVATQVRITVSDGITSTSSSYHTGGGAVEELSVSHTVSSTATTLTIAVEVNGDNTVCYVDTCALVYGSLTDAVRRDDYQEELLDVSALPFDQGGGALRVKLPQRSFGGQYIITAGRPYAAFPEARIWADQADADSSDAPLDHVAYAALAALYEALRDAENLSPDLRGLYEAKRASWEAKASRLLTDYRYESKQNGVSNAVPMWRTLMPAARR